MPLNSTQMPFILSSLGIMGIIVFLILERWIPFRQARISLGQRWFINFSMSFCNLLVVDQFFVILLQRTELFSSIFNFNLYARLGLNSFWRIVVTIVVLDLVTYLWHRVNHGIPFLWRFHRVHHTDMEVDVSTASRFHFGEMTISAMINYALMLSLGASMMEIRIFKVVFVFMTQLTHSNIRLWKPLENILWLFIVPPAMHRVHHSNVKRETDSNYGTIFSLWDRLFGTFRSAGPGGIIFGLKEFIDPGELTLWKLLALPFRKKSNVSTKGG